MGYHRAGFEVVGIDIVPQPRYPFEFFQQDAMEVAPYAWALDFDAVHASPPCQAHSVTQKIRGREHPDLIGQTRRALIGTGLPYVIENVPGSPLLDPVEICGCMFDGLGVYRPRLFETSFPLAQPAHRPHAERQTKMGRPPVDGERMHVVGNFSGVARARVAMGMPWATRNGLREAIPPAYTEHVGRELARVV